MRHVWSVICQLSIVDHKRNNITLVEVIEALTLTLQPGQEIPVDQPVLIPLSLELVSSWVRDEVDSPETGRARILVFSPAGELLNKEENREGFEYEIDLHNHTRSRNMGRFEAIPFAGSGLYWYTVQSFNEQNQQWKDVASIPLELKVDEINKASEN